MTGRYPHATGARRNETWMPPGTPHLFRLWKSRGYRTGLIGKNHCFQPRDDNDLFDVWCEVGHSGPLAGTVPKGLSWQRPASRVSAAHAVRREMPQQSPRFGYAATEFAVEDYSSSLIADQAVRFIQNHESGSIPFALFVSFPDPHPPYEAPKAYVERFLADQIEIPPWRLDEFGEDAPERNRVLHEMLGVRHDNPEHIRSVLAVYFAMIRLVDDSIGRILDTVERLGLKQNTIVALTADHGDFMGEHGMVGKGGVFYDSLTRVPLIISWPGHVASGFTEGSLVSTVDVAPTLLWLQGIPTPHGTQGSSLPRVTESAAREAVFSEYGAGGPPFTFSDLVRLPRPYGRRTIWESLQWREAEGRRKMVRTVHWKYVHDPLGDKDELYDLVNDPLEHRNVAAISEHRFTIQEMKDRLLEWAIVTEGGGPVELPAADHYQV